MEQLVQEETEFERRYAEWMKQYTDWKEENQSKISDYFNFLLPVWANNWKKTFPWLLDSLNFLIDINFTFQHSWLCTMSLSLYCVKIYGSPIEYYAKSASHYSRWKFHEHGIRHSCMWNIFLAYDGNEIVFCTIFCYDKQKFYAWQEYRSLAVQTRDLHSSIPTALTVGLPQ